MLSLFRVSSIVLVLGLRIGFTYNTYLEMFFSFLFCHYALSFWYSRRRLVKLVKNQSTWLPSLSLIGMAGQMIYTASPGLLYYFGFHHVLTDTYGVQKHCDPENLEKNLRQSRFWINGLGFLFLFRDSLVLPLLVKIIVVAWIGATLWFVHAWLKSKDRRLDVLGFEFTGLVACFILSSFLPRIEDIIFYHLAFWFLLPLKELQNKRNYLLSTCLLTLGFYFFMPSMPGGAWLSFGIFSWQHASEIFGYLHITSTFALSRLNPTWIREMFSEKSAEVPALSKAA